MNNALDGYRTRGHCVLRGRFDEAEIAAWRVECDRLLALELVAPGNGRTPFRFGAREVPERIDPVVDISPCFAELVADPRLREPVAELLGDEPLLFKDKLIFKAPGVGGYPMHQDWAWGWQDLCPADRVLSVSIQIDGADPANGCIELFDGYHDALLTPPGEATNFGPDEEALIGPGRGGPVATDPGDVLTFHSLTPHRSGPNTADRPRRSLYLTFNARAAGDLRGDYYAAYRGERGRHGGDFFR